MKKCIVSLAAIVVLCLGVTTADAGRIPGPGIDTKVCVAHGSVTYFDTIAITPLP